MTKSKIGRVFSYAVVLLVIIAVVGIFARFTNGFTSEFKTFYVSVNGKEVLSADKGYTVAPYSPLLVEVKYTFAFAETETQDYFLQIVPNKTGEDFYFSVDGETHYFSDETDLTNGFTIDKREKSFTVAPKGVTLQEVLQAAYPQNVVTCDCKGYDDTFILVVTSYNGKSSVKIYFTLERGVSGVTLDRKEIVF